MTKSQIWSIIRNGLQSLVPTGERIITATSSSVNGTYTLVPQVISAAPFVSATWDATEQTTVTGSVNQIAFAADGSYEYICIDVNTWKRRPMGLRSVQLVAGTISDSATGIQTSAQLTTAFPNALDYQRVYGTFGYYELRSGLWRHYLGNNSGITGSILFGLNNLLFGTAGVGGGITAAGIATFASLAGTGTRMVTANSTGVLSSQAIPTQANSEVLQTITATATINNATTLLLVNPSTLAASATATLPATPSQNQVIELLFGGTITTGNAVVTSFTITPNSGQTLMFSGTIGGVTAGMVIKVRYVGTNWYKS